MSFKFIYKNGFTLVELLVVIALSSIIMLGVFEGYFVVKKLIINYHQNIRLQNTIRAVTYEVYKLAQQAGQMGCAHTNNPIYLHLSKASEENLRQLLYIKNNQLQGLAFLQPTDLKIKVLLPPTVYNRLTPDSAVIYTLQAISHSKYLPKKGYAIYSDCQDVFILPIKDSCIDCFDKMPAIRFAGHLEVDLYFIANNKRKNEHGRSIYSLYKYNAYYGLQEILEGVEKIDLNSNVTKIKMLLSSVEGKETVKQWLTISI